MKAMMRIAPLLLGLGFADACAEEPGNPEERASPIFVIRVPAAPAAPAGTPERPLISPVTRQLAELIRRDAGEPTGGATPDSGSSAATPETLHLEKMTVSAPKIIELPGHETFVEKFTRTGYLWEFSPTKHFMVGPRGDKVGIMFSFDW
jgi:hypothetical protein